MSTSQNKPTCIGLTIGPIYKTMGAARKTVQLWAASYIFSHLMKKIIAAVLAKQKSDPGFQVVILNPLADADRGAGSTAGLYPDRLILKSRGEGDFKETVELARKEVEAFGRRIAQTYFPNEREQSVLESVHRYFQTYLVEIELSPGDESVLIAMNQHLDTAELQTAFIANDREDDDFIYKFLDEIIKRRWLLEKVFDLEKLPTILSLESIALHSLKADREKWRRVEALAGADEDENLNGPAKKIYGEEMKKHHSYVAIIHADGDNVGKTIQAMQSTEEFQRFCSSLMDYGEASIEEINKFGGLPIYAGGDDLLFFAPIQGQDGDHVFNLLERLNGIFSEKLEAQVKELNAAKGLNLQLPTLSFGLSVTYYKYPLYEALEASRYQLFVKAKRHDGKNAIAVNIRLHSDHALGKVFSLRKNAGGAFADAAYRHLRQLTGDSLKQENLRLSSVTHALDKNKTLLGVIGADKKRMQSFFKNSFNEDVHQMDDYKAFWTLVQSLLVTSFQADSTVKKGKPVALENAESVLRILHFLNQENDEQ